jgi:hypothetical protein
MSWRGLPGAAGDLRRGCSTSTTVWTARLRSTPHGSSGTEARSSSVFSHESSVVCGTDNSGVRMLMPSTSSAYPQVASRRFASFRVVKSSISAVQAVLCAWFDSRQLHRRGQARPKGLACLRCGQRAVTGTFALEASRCEFWVPGQSSMNSIAVEVNSAWYWKIAPWPESG